MQWHHGKANFVTRNQKTKQKSTTQDLQVPAIDFVFEVR